MQKRARTYKIYITDISNQSINQRAKKNPRLLKYWIHPSKDPKIQRKYYRTPKYMAAQTQMQIHNHEKGNFNSSNFSIRTLRLLSKNRSSESD